MKARVISGLDRIEEFDALLRPARVGLMTNPTGVTHGLQSGIDLLHSRYHLSALFGCEHGVRGDAQAGDAVDSSRDEETGVTIYSLYGKTSRMTAEMLDAFDVLVFDMQDVGARFYTYLYSLAYAMEECAKAGKTLLVLDRVNPIGGLKREGTILDTRLRSFVGDYALPTRTGLTIGEYARYVKDYLKLDLDLRVAPLLGWRRKMYLDETNLPWVAPSPNCPSLASALVYPGACIFEGVNVSEGRGTAQPFELIGAPWLRAAPLEKEMNALRLPGLYFRRCSFRPTFSKYQGEVCRGVQLHITDRGRAEVCLAALKLLETIIRLHPGKVEYLSLDEGKSYALDRLLGTDSFRLGQKTADEVMAESAPGVAAFSEKVKPFLLYE